jgi:hypothetical protein
MKANVQYNDFKGTVSADIAGHIGGIGGDDLRAIGEYFNLDAKRFRVVGLSIDGTESQYACLICVDKERSTESKEFIVSMSLGTHEGENLMSILFKRLQIMLHDRYDEKYPSMAIDEGASFEDFHTVDENE